MGLLSIIRKQKLKDKQIRVLILGLDNAGKTTIVKRLLDEDVKEVSPTVGFAIHSYQMRSYNLDIWDVGGQKSLRPFWQNYFERTDALIWVIDATALDRLSEAKRELHNTLTESKLVGASLLLLVNKVDAVEHGNVAEILATVTEVLSLMDLSQHNYKVLECSAITGQNVHEGIEWIVDEAESRIYPS